MLKYLPFLIVLIFTANSLQAATDTRSMEKLLTDMVNAERAKVGLSALTVWKPLCKVARIHSENMAGKKVDFGHAGFDERAASLKRDYCLQTLGENVAYSYNVKDHLSSALTGWLKSPSHRQNIEGDFKETGIGIAFSSDGGFYVTQLFATRTATCK